MMQLNGHISSMIHYSIGHIRKLYRLSGKVASTNAKENLCMDENLQKENIDRTQNFKEELTILVLKVLINI